MESVDNNQFEVKLTKRKIETGPNVYLNPALDLLVNEDPMCNTAMEITPNKRRKRTKSCDIVAFENTALDLGISKAAVNEFLQRELDNVRKNIKHYETPIKLEPDPKQTQAEPIYANLNDLTKQSNRLDKSTDLTKQSNRLDKSTDFTKEDTVQNDKFNGMQDSELEMDSGISVHDQKSLNTAYNSELDCNDISAITNTTNVQTNVTNQIFMNNTSNLSLSFIDRLAIDSPGTSNQSFYFDDDLNESNIMEIKTITIITKKKLISNKKNTNPFLDPNLNVNNEATNENPFFDQDPSKDELEYNIEAMNRPLPNPEPAANLIPRKLFTSDTNSTISTVNESVMNAESHEYENIDSYRSESPIYENIGEDLSDTHYNKQSKILGCDVSQFSAVDIMNLNRNSGINNSNVSNDSKKDLKHQILKAGNKLSKKVFKTLRKKFKGEKVEHNVSLNPYEVPRKQPKEKTEKKDSGIENPCLNLDNSDEIEIEEIEDEHEYETIKTVRNTRLNTNVTPLKERTVDNFDVSIKSNTPGKKVRFDSTLNREKIITGNSFDCDIQSPGLDARIDKYHDELENCINERKFLQQNM